MALARKTFFDLPAEIRNAIYETVANCNLELWGASKDGQFPSLLLASRRCREEYMSVLLATARIELKVTDLNFSQLLETLENLDITSRKALSSNPSLRIALRIQRCGSNVFANLRTWCEAQSAMGYVAKWQYVMDAQDESNAAQLDWYCGRIRVLEQRSQLEGVKKEARKVLDVVEGKRAGQSSMGSWSMGLGEVNALRAASEARRT